MDKILRRVRMAERQVTRRRKKLATTEFLSEVKRKSMKETQDLHEDAVLALHQARKARREDWEMGPIAPRREVPRVADGNFADPILWGTISPARAFSNVQRSPQALEQRCAWAGGREFCCLAEGDRVVITEGPMKGRLDKVSQVDLDAGMVRLEDAKTNVTVPSWLKDAGAVAALPLRLPISSVRLVHPITDEETGVTKDVIIKELKPIRVLPDRPTRTVTWSRVVPGLNITIPWPRVEKPKVDDNACDTLRIDVEERTFIPTLLSPPMPEDLINELRNQYSKFRTRHTPEYIAKKAAEDDEKRAKKEQDKEMLTPVQEFNRMQREIRRARGQPVLTEEMLAKIGEVMARNLNARGERTVHSIPAETVGAKGSETASS